MKKILSSALVALSLLAGFSAASIPLVYAQKESAVVYNDAGMTETEKHVDGNYKANASGQTYGNAVDSVYIEDLPDLVSVIGDNGKEGYVYTHELFDSPSSPEEAMKEQEAIENGSYVPKVLNVYNSDGTTVIDTLTETLPVQYAK